MTVVINRTGDHVWSTATRVELCEVVETLSAQLSATAQVSAMQQRDTGLTFKQLHDANLSRCGRWHPGFPADETWTGADWANAVGGEGGELLEAAENIALRLIADAAKVAQAIGKMQNTVKKIRRYETGTNTALDKPLDVLLAEFDAEMADIACYLDLLATKYGRDLAGAIAAKFNAVSIKRDFPERLSA